MYKIITYCFALWLLVSCHSKSSTASEEAKSSRTPVSIVAAGNEPMEEYVELNATSSFQQKWVVRANATGYLQSANVQLNKPVQSGQVLYTVKTKEAQSIGNAINILDSGFRFSGVNTIRANGSGFISQINHQNGDYVQDGDQLALITDTRSFVFLLDMPYELRPYVMDKKSLEMVLPDGEKLTGTLAGNLPTMDAGSQTQSVVLKVQSPHPLPENLIAKVKVVKSYRNNTPSLPRAAVLTDETQSEFWVMKMINDSTAVKVSVKKGIESREKIEILLPVFSATDKIIVTGNYGLSDTARVQIVKE